MGSRRMRSQVPTASSKQVRLMSMLSAADVVMPASFTIWDSTCSPRRKDTKRTTSSSFNHCSHAAGVMPSSHTVI